MIPVSNVTHRSKVNNAASNTMHMILLALVCEISKLFQETVNDCLAELSLSKRENASMGWVALEVDEAASSQSRKLEMTHEYCWSHDASVMQQSMFVTFYSGVILYILMFLMFNQGLSEDILVLLETICHKMVCPSLLCLFMFSPCLPSPPPFSQCFSLSLPLLCAFYTFAPPPCLTLPPSPFALLSHHVAHTYISSSSSPHQHYCNYTLPLYSSFHTL